LGILAPIAWNLTGDSRNSLISCSSATASSAPATSAKVTLGWSLDTVLALAFPNVHHPGSPPCMVLRMKMKPPKRIRIGRKLRARPTHTDCLLWWPDFFDAVIEKVLGERARVPVRIGGLIPVTQRAPNTLEAPLTLLDPSCRVAEAKPGPSRPFADTPPGSGCRHAATPKQAEGQQQEHGSSNTYAIGLRRASSCRLQATGPTAG